MALKFIGVSVAYMTKIFGLTDDIAVTFFDATFYPKHKSDPNFVLTAYNDESVLKIWLIKSLNFC